MCFCTPSKRTPYCDKCVWYMADKYKKLLNFIKEFHANPSDEFIIKARDLLKEIENESEK